MIGYLPEARTRILVGLLLVCKCEIFSTIPRLKYNFNFNKIDNSLCLRAYSAGYARATSLRSSDSLNGG